jgi:hypothetical protein
VSCVGGLAPSLRVVCRGLAPSRRYTARHVCISTRRKFAPLLSEIAARGGSRDGSRARAGAGTSSGEPERDLGRRPRRRATDCRREPAAERTRERPSDRPEKPRKHRADPSRRRCERDRACVHLSPLDQARSRPNAEYFQASEQGRGADRAPGRAARLAAGHARRARIRAGHRRGAIDPIAANFFDRAHTDVLGPVEAPRPQVVLRHNAARGARAGRGRRGRSRDSRRTVSRAPCSSPSSRLASSPSAICGLQAVRATHGIRSAGRADHRRAQHRQQLPASSGLLSAPKPLVRSSDRRAAAGSLGCGRPTGA